MTYDLTYDLTWRSANAIDDMLRRAVASVAVPDETATIARWRETQQGQAVIVWLEALSRDLAACVRLLSARCTSRNDVAQARKEHQRVQLLRCWLLHDITPELGGIDDAMRAEASRWLVAACRLSRKYPSPHTAIHRTWCRDLCEVLGIRWEQQ